MKRTLIAGLAALVLSCDGGYVDNGTYTPPERNITQEAYDGEVYLNLGTMRSGLGDPVLSIGPDKYIFNNTGTAYTIVKVAETEPLENRIIIRFEDPYQDRTATLSLEDGKTYELKYDAVAGQYQLTARE
jgi:hypothetical protein